MLKFYSCVLCMAVGASAAFASADLPLHKSRKGALKAVATAPAVKAPSDVTATGFTANWEAVAGADGYCVFVYEPVAIDRDGTYRVLDESFNLVNVGSTVEPVWDESFSCSLDRDYDFTFTPDWTVIGCAFAKGMVSGNVYTPTIDLTNDGGKYRLVLDIVGQQGTKIRVTSTGATEETKEAVLDQPGGGRIEMEFANGNHETYLYIVDMGIEGDDDGEYANVLSFFDNIAIEQDLKAGDTVLRLVDLNDAVNAPATSCRFDNMKFLYDAKQLCYDLYAAYVYDDPDDPWNYEIDYSGFSELQDVQLAGAGLADTVAAPDAGTVRVYDLSGRCIDKPLEQLRPGVYVVCEGGSARKVLIK